MLLVLYVQYRVSPTAVATSMGDTGTGVPVRIYWYCTNTGTYILRFVY